MEKGGGGKTERERDEEMEHKATKQTEAKQSVKTKREQAGEEAESFCPEIYSLQMLLWVSISTQL